MARENPKMVSLFTGAGGLDYGFEAAGFRTAVALEVDPACVETLHANRNWPVINKDIHDVTGHEVLKAGGLRRGEVDLVIGGPPCQPFSKSGYWSTGDAKRMSDPRASTLGAMLRVVRDIRPRAILIENVDALAYRGKNEGLSWLLNELGRFNEQTGTHYHPSVAVLNAADYGVPQRRRRILIVASRDGRPFNFPEPSHSGNSAMVRSSGRKPHTTAWDAIGDLSSVSNEILSLRGRWSDLLPSIPEGQNYLYHTDRGGGVPLFGWRRRYWSFLLKLAKAVPSWTIQAEPGPATGPFHAKICGQIGFV